MKTWNGSFQLKSASLLLFAGVVSGICNLTGGATALAQAQASRKPGGNQVVATPPGAIALRDQLRSLINVSTYTGDTKQLGSHVVLNKIGTVYTVRRSNVLIATYFSKDKYAGVRVLNPAPDEDRYYAVTKYCHNESVVTFPDVSLSPLSDKCRRSLAMGKAALIHSGKRVLVADVEIVPDQDLVSFVLMDHHQNQDKNEDPRYLSGVRAQLPHGLLASGDAGQIFAALKQLLIPANDPLLSEVQPFLPDAPEPDFTLEDKLNALLKPQQFRVADGSFAPDTTLNIKASRFLKGSDMYSMIVGCLPTIEDGKLQKESLLCRGIKHGEPDGSHNTYLRPEDQLEIDSIKVESKKDKDLIRVEVNDWSQQNHLPPPRLSDAIDIEVNGEQIDYTSNLDHTGFHAAMYFQYPKGGLEHSDAKQIAADIANVFNVQKASPAVAAATPTPSAPPPVPAALNTVPYSGAATAPQSLEDQLKTLYTLTKVGGDSTVLSRGTVFNLAADKILLGTPVAKPAVCPAIVSDGTPKPPAAACLTPLKPSIARHESAFLPQGQKLDLIFVAVSVPKETVTLTFVDDTVAGKARFRTAVNFVFPQGYLEGSDAGQVSDTVSTVLPISDPNATPRTASVPAPIPASTPGPMPPMIPVSRQPFGVPRGPGQVASMPVADVAQPVGEPAKVTLGMSKADVQKSLGAPNKVMDLGAKTIFVYSDVKVTFQNGKVADVQ